MTAAVEVRGLRAGYHGVEVVHGIDFQVSPGEIVAIFGPNGAGKTTTLSALAGLLPNVAGDIRWHGKVRRWPPHRLANAGVAFVGERSVFHGLSTEANLRLGKGDPAVALEIFPELVPLLKRRAGLLSGGEQQMLTMGRALASRPQILLLDEVSAGLAPVAVTRLFTAVQHSARDGIAILLVEQQVRRALTIADRGYVLSRGNITFTGSKSDLADHFRAGDTYFTSAPTEERGSSAEGGSPPEDGNSE